MRESRTSGSEGGAACGLSLPLSWSAGACSRLLPTQSTLSILPPFSITPLMGRPTFLDLLDSVDPFGFRYVPSLEFIHGPRHDHRMHSGRRPRRQS